MASSFSQRQRVMPLTLATIPLLVTSLCSSEIDKRDKGIPISRGISQAKALTSIITAGGKNPGSSTPRFILQAYKALIIEALVPFAYHLTRSI